MIFYKKLLHWSINNDSLWYNLFKTQYVIPMGIEYIIYKFTNFQSLITPFTTKIIKIINWKPYNTDIKIIWRSFKKKNHFFSHNHHPLPSTQNPTPKIPELYWPPSKPRRKSLPTHRHPTDAAPPRAEAGGRTPAPLQTVSDLSPDAVSSGARTPTRTDAPWPWTSVGVPVVGACLDSACWVRCRGEVAICRAEVASCRAEGAGCRAEVAGCRAVEVAVGGLRFFVSLIIFCVIGRKLWCFCGIFVKRNWWKFYVYCLIFFFGSKIYVWMKLLSSTVLYFVFL